MTQGKIERYHRSMKNVVKLDPLYSPWEVEAAIAAFADYYNNYRYHEALDNLTPADVYFGRVEEVKSRRAEIKQKTLQERRNFNLQMTAHSV
jgi:transposase InsO family protein